MGLTIANINKTSVGNKWLVTAQVTFDSSYPTGGEDLAPSGLKLKTIESLFAEVKGAYVFEYDYSGAKLKAYSAVGTEVSDTTDLAAVAGVRILAIGL